ncbi:MAG TPA: M12 family metallo-peptidase [Hyphomicrobiaceae bacterium]|nr:M12 family metallo-peptidase [Hyphomicrobiaceae bacterium]
MIGLRIAAAAAVAAALVFGAGPPAKAQGGEERVPLIMSKLPPAGSQLYNAIKRHAGRAKGQVLTLTKTEMWAVPKRNVEAVKRAAARHGVGVDQLGNDWNHVFHSAPSDMKMDDKQQSMVDRAKSSRASMGVGMMMAPRAPTVEYALTKDANSPAAAHDAAKIIVKLNADKVLTITRVSVDIKPSMCVWRGTVDGTDAPATIMWWPGGKMAGTVQHEGRIYSIRHVGGEMHAVVEMGEDRMPEEHAPMPARMRNNDPNLRDDPLLQQGDASRLRPVTAGMQPVPPPARRQQPKLAAGQGKLMPGKAKAAPASKDIVIDVLVAYTKKTASNYSDVKRELIDLAIEEGNESFRMSHLGNIKLRLVHAYQTDYVEDDGEHFDHLYRMVDKGDGYMEEVHGLRDKYHADVVVLIVDDASGCGLATRVFAEASDAFAVVHHECAASSYSLAHEIGHLIGARHDTSIDKNMVPFPYGHGFVNGTKWRDIMSYKASCGGCPRLPVWSSPKVLIRGEPAGTPDLDNARVILEQAARVAAFR